MGQGFCSIHSCGEFDDAQFQTTDEPQRVNRPKSVDIERMSHQDFVDLSKSG